MSRHSPEFLKSLLEKMLLIRIFEEKAAQMYGLRKICGFLHLYVGQEAVAVGAVSAMDPSRDYVVAAYRDHGHALACGMDPKIAMAELFGKITGCSKGKGGSMHFFDAEHHMLGGNGIVGSQIPVATGVALKIRNMKEDGVVLCFFGDGAVHQGAFHESLNMARIWNLPIIYICENNQYGMGTFYKRVSAVTDFSKMTVAYDIPGKTIDGMDVLTVYEEVSDAIEKVRQESIPRFFEIKTYRYRGHSMSDPAKYRTKEEVEEYRRLDPIERLKSKMLEWGVLTNEEYVKLQKKVMAQVEEAVEFAETSPEPPLQELYRDVLVEEG